MGRQAADKPRSAEAPLLEQLCEPIKRAAVERWDRSFGARRLGNIPVLARLQFRRLRPTKSEKNARSALHLPRTLLQIHCVLKVAAATKRGSNHRQIHSCTTSRALELCWRKHRRDGGGPGGQMHRLGHHNRLADPVPARRSRQPNLTSGKTRPPARRFRNIELRRSGDRAAAHTSSRDAASTTIAAPQGNLPLHLSTCRKRVGAPFSTTAGAAEGGESPQPRCTMVGEIWSLLFRLSTRERGKRAAALGDVCRSLAEVCANSYMLSSL